MSPISLRALEDMLDLPVRLIAIHHTGAFMERAELILDGFPELSEEFLR